MRRGRARLVVLAGATRGQAAVELVALAPLVCALALAFGTALLAGAAAVAAEHAASRGVAAAALGHEPLVAARSALPRALARHARVQVRAGAVVVVVDVPGPAPPWRASARLVEDAGAGP
jgi:hypothetical protein